MLFSFQFPALYGKVAHYKRRRGLLSVLYRIYILCAGPLINHSQCPNKKLLYILFLASALKKRSMNLGSKYKKFLDLGTSVLLIPLTSALNLQQSLIFAPFEKRKFR